MASTQDDYQRFYQAVPDPGFSPERNKKVIEETIKKTEKNHIDRQKQYLEGLYERSDAVMSYIKKLVNDHRSYSVEKYLGKDYLDQLRGERKLAKIRQLAQNKGYL